MSPQCPDWPASPALCGPQPLHPRSPSLDSAQPQDPEGLRVVQTLAWATQPSPALCWGAAVLSLGPTCQLVLGALRGGGEKERETESAGKGADPGAQVLPGGDGAGSRRCTRPPAAGRRRSPGEAASHRHHSSRTQGPGHGPWSPAALLQPSCCPPPALGCRIEQMQTPWAVRVEEKWPQWGG